MQIWSSTPSTARSEGRIKPPVNSRPHNWWSPFRRNHLPNKNSMVWF